MNFGPQILVVCSHPTITDELSQLLLQCGVVPVHARGVTESKSILAAGRVALVVCSTHLADGSYADLISQLRRSKPPVPVVIASSLVNNDEYREYLNAMRLGAFDFICSPYRRLEIERIVNNVLRGSVVGAHA